MRNYRRPFRIKKKKSILKNRFFWLGILILIVFSGVFYLICFHSFFQVKEIRIEKVSVDEAELHLPPHPAPRDSVTESLESLLNEKISQKVLFFPSQSIFLTDFGEIKKEILKSFPHIAEVDLKRKFPHTVLLEIKERKPAAIFRQADKNFFVDKEGVIFESLDLDVTSQDFIIFKKQADEEVNLGEKMAEEDPFFFPLVPLGSSVIKEEQLSKILEVESKLKNELKILVEEILVVSEARFDAKTLEGFQIYFNFQEDLDWQLAKLKALLEEEIPLESRKDLEYIDVRFGNFAPYKYRG